jgi:hypothetical protein
MEQRYGALLHLEARSIERTHDPDYLKPEKTRIKASDE